MAEVDNNRILQAARNTEVLRPPRQTLSTFGTTRISYYLVTEPIYPEVVETSLTETVIREGNVLAERPKIVTPHYLSHLEGFSSVAGKYFQMMVNEYGPDAPGIFYAYKNDPTDLNIVSEDWQSVARKLIDDIDRRGDPLVSVIKGQDDLWDISIMKFIFEMTRRSMGNNISQFSSRGLLKVDSSGVPREARNRIEELFWQVSRGERDPNELKLELDRWGVFDEYEDRFLALFRKNKIF
ncbi:hypothetical protein ACFLWN_01560 [Chloroflexota bacterium]